MFRAAWGHVHVREHRIQFSGYLGVQEAVLLPGLGDGHIPVTPRPIRWAQGRLAVPLLGWVSQTAQAGRLGSAPRAIPARAVCAVPTGCCPHLRNTWKYGCRTQ